MTAVAQPEVSRLGAAYERVYGMLAGTRPGLLPWHFQWLATCDIRRDMAEVLPSCRGELLDIGCGAKPYRALAKNVDRYIGMDIEAGPDVDLVLVPGQPIPLPDASQDVVTCIFLFHELPPEVRRGVTAEIARVLKPGGLFVFIDSMQMGDKPAWDGLLEAFPVRFHEPYFRSYAIDDLDAMFANAGLDAQSTSRAFLSKVMVRRKRNT